jgi:uncharacterized protein (DUF362 family)
MKRILIGLLALGAILAFASFAMAAKSVVAIVKASPEDAKIMDGGFHINDDVAHEQTREYHEATGDYTRALWDPASEDMWYKYTKQAVDLAGGIPLKKGETVLIKTNHVLSFYPMQWMGFGDDNSIQGAFTDPRLCLALARICAEMGAGRIIIAECPALGDAWATFMNYGLMWPATRQKYADMGVKYELVDLCEDWEMMPGLGLASKQYPMPKILKKINVLVNACCYKTHEYAGVTLCLKNLGIGLPSQRVIGACKFGLPHQHVAEVHTDVNYIAQKLVPRQFHIIDALYAGTWVPVAPYFLSGMIIASKDPVACDAIGTATMNLNPRNIGTTRLGAKHGLGKMEYDEIEVVGVPLEEAIIQDFPRHPYKARKWPWTPDMYGKVSNWDQYYRHELYGVANYPRW